MAVSVHMHVWWLQELGTLTLPVLKTLSATIYHAEEERTLAKFLENQRSLEELTVDFGCRESLMASIRGRCLELRKLDLSSRGSPGDAEEWRFLGSMSRLKEFRFKDPFVASVRNGWRLLAFLPKNQLERLSLEGISSERRGFWYADGVEEPFGVKTQLLQGFRCLRTLSFVGSRDVVDDQLMQWLLKEFVSLEEFQLSDCSTLTDAGISGKTTAEWGRDASFAKLRRLKTLKIVRCGGVTPNGVLESCADVSGLKSLEYTNPRGQIAESMVMKLLEQNPRLQRLSLDYQGDLEELKGKLMKKYPRVELSKAQYDW